MITCPLCGATNLAGADPCESCGQPLASAAGPVAANEVGRQILADPLGPLARRPAPCIGPERPVDMALEASARDPEGFYRLAQVTVGEVSAR